MSDSKKTPIAIITGGSRGLGRNVAQHLARRGADVILTYKSGADAAKTAIAEVEKAGRKGVALPLDVADSSTFGAFADAVKGALGSTFNAERFDWLVNNAGIGIYGSFVETSEAQFDELMRTHLKGPFFLTQKLLPLIADGGRIVNVSTGLARFAIPGYSAYATMKGGIEVLTRYLAKELGPRKISVNTIAPGAIETDFGGGAVRDNEQMNKMVAGMTAMGRVGLPDDIGSAVASLLTADANWITGQRIEVSGGMLL
jgi:NAD(P)-dependent dehydrogenase (short-subunit alcohol dehydrogenase family)